MGQENINQNQNRHIIVCPNCGGTNINVQVVTVTESKTKGFGWCKGCIGAIIWLPLFFCGLCGMGKGKTTTKEKTVKVCQDCGHTF